ncbi:MAG: tetratricopeptide repeat protein [Planctomycetia bacterium]|nr:tetratricopeptide repeat protein [Planctomycetia bacterium]
MAGMLAFGSAERPAASAVDALDQARIAQANGRLEDAERGARRLLGAASTRADARVLLGQILLERSKAAEAKDEFEVVVKADASNFEAALGLARALERLGQGAPALFQYARAAHLRESDSRPWRELGLAAERIGDDPQAIDALRRSLALAPDQPDLSNLLARLEARQNEWESGGVATMRHRAVNPEDFLPKSPVPDPNDWLPKPAGKPR